MRGPSRGMSLPELLVGLFLTTIFMGLLHQLFQTTYRVGHEEMGRASTEQALHVVGNALQSDLKGTSPGGLSLVPDGSRVATHPISSVTDRGSLIYQDRLWLWAFDSNQNILTRSELLENANRRFEGPALRLEPAELMAVNPGERISRSLKNVTEFVVQNPPGVTAPHVGTPLRISMKVTRSELRTRSEITYETAVHLRTARL